MSKGSWRTDVAEQLEQCAAAVRNRADRSAVAALGTAIGYLQQAEEIGARGAAALLAQAASARRDDDTQRFSYAPGELELLAGLQRRE